MVEQPDDVPEGVDWKSNLNPASLQVLRGKVEPALAAVPEGARYQFERKGYFIADPDSRSGLPVFNQIVPLRDSWAKAQGKS